MRPTIEEAVQQLQLRRAVLSEQRAQSSVIIGKDILELLSSAMYVDPLTLYREYLQNSADAIDDAFMLGILPAEAKGEISISIDTSGREIRIRDNGTGLCQRDAEALLTAFGASPKRGSSSRGFRGVGRLSGLGYSQYLTFSTKASGEDVATEVRWDCRALKQILRDPKYAGQLGDVVKDIVMVRSIAAPNRDEHFFEVRLEKPIRIKNDVLLNVPFVTSYICQVAPLPFNDAFSIGPKIAERLAEYIPSPRFSVRVNESRTPLGRPFADEICVTAAKSDHIVDYEWISILDSNNSPRAVGWVAKHSYLGALRASHEVRGLRARCGDIQIGGEEIFTEIFPEARFSSWTIGELHILDRNIVPNGRRDNFEQNPAYHSLISQLLPLGRSIARKCRESSVRRNRARQFELHELRVTQDLAVLRQNLVPQSTITSIIQEIDYRIRQMEKLLGGTLLLDSERSELSARLKKLTLNRNAASEGKLQKDLLQCVPAKKRGVYRELVGLIYECMPVKQDATRLVDRITSKLIGL